MIDARFRVRSEAFAFIEEVDRMSDPDEVVRCMRRVLDDFGLQSLILGGFTNANKRYEDLILVQQMPAEWLTRYVEKRYVTVDPVFRRLTRSTMPFEWREAEYDPENEPRAAEAMQSRWDVGLTNGLVIPVQRLNKRGYVSVSGRWPELTARTKPAIHLVALYAFERISGLVGRGLLGREGLTGREREVLTWAAAGKTSAEIGEILGIAKRTVDAHTRTAARKLGAVNRTQAVAIAVSDRTITSEPDCHK